METEYSFHAASAATRKKRLPVEPQRDEFQARELTNSRKLAVPVGSQKYEASTDGRCVYSDEYTNSFTAKM